MDKVLKFYKIKKLGLYKLFILPRISKITYKGKFFKDLGFLYKFKDINLYFFKINLLDFFNFVKYFQITNRRVVKFLYFLKFFK